MYRTCPWTYIAIFCLCVGGFLTVFDLKQKTAQITDLQGQINSLKKDVSERENKIEAGMVKVQDVLNLHQQANDQQAKVDQSFLTFMKSVNTRLGNNE